MFVYRYDPKRPYFSSLSRTFNSLSTVVSVGILVLFILSITGDCDCSYDAKKKKNESEALQSAYLIALIVLTCYSAFIALVFNLLFPPNAVIYQTSHSEYAGTVYNPHSGVAMDVVKVTTTTHNEVDVVEPITKRFTLKNLQNLTFFFLIMVPLIIMTFYLIKFTNQGCKDCCVAFKYDDDRCAVPNKNYFGNTKAWEDFEGKDKN
eukprot:gene2530-3133_t